MCYKQPEGASSITEGYTSRLGTNHLPHPHRTFRQPPVTYQLSAVHPRRKKSTVPSNKSAGPDSIPAEALKADVKGSVELLHPFYNKIWEEEKVPTKWKEGYTSSSCQRKAISVVAQISKGYPRKSVQQSSTARPKSWF